MLSRRALARLKLYVRGIVSGPLSAGLFSIRFILMRIILRTLPRSSCRPRVMIENNAAAIMAARRVKRRSLNSDEYY